MTKKMPLQNAAAGAHSLPSDPAPTVEPSPGKRRDRRGKPGLHRWSSFRIQQHSLVFILTDDTTQSDYE